MKQRLIIGQFLTILFLLTTASVTFASHSPTNTRPDLLRQYDKTFTFDWNKHTTIAANKRQIDKIESLLKNTHDTGQLNDADRKALGSLLYKLGTFYTHVTPKPDLAIARMNQANTILANKQDKAWNYNHLAYAYELKYAISSQADDKEKALYYTNKVISQLYPQMQNKEVAFAYCVKGLIYSDTKDYAMAETNFKTALQIYESIPGGKDEQYAKAKTHLATVLQKNQVQ